MPSVDDLRPIVGEWKTTGNVLDENGVPTLTIAGTDTYRLLPGDTWIVHTVDVQMGGDRQLVHELVGGEHPEGGWCMYAFDQDNTPGLMRLTRESPGLLLLHGDGIRSWFRTDTGDSFMTARWERLVGDTWLPWMNMRFDRSA